MLTTGSISLSDIKEHLGVTFSDDDRKLNSLIATSEMLILSQLVEDESTLPFFVNNQVYLLAVKMLCAHFYMNPSATSSFEKHELPFGMKYIVQALRKDLMLWNSVD